MKYIKIFKNKNNEEYVFNGKTLELFLKNNEDEYKDYITEHSNQKINSINTYKDEYLMKLTFNVSNKCNLCCKYCYASHGNYGNSEGVMNKYTIDKIISDVKRYGYKRIGILTLFGGEPTINFKNIKYIVDKTKKSFLSVDNIELTTNTTLITDSMIKFFIDNNIKLVLSVDGPKDITNFLRGKGVFECVENCINKLKHYNYNNFEVSATYTKKHLDFGYTYNDIIKFFKDKGILANVSKVIANSNDDLYISDAISINEFRKIVKMDLDSIVNNNITIINPYLNRLLDSIIFEVKSYGYCDDLQTNYSLCYDYNGDLFNCFRLWGKNNFKTDIKELISSKLSYINNKTNFNICSECWAFYLCKNCIVDLLFGDMDFPIQNGVCKYQKMYEICMSEFLNILDIIDLDKFCDNFSKFSRYKGVKYE